MVHKTLAGSSRKCFQPKTFEPRHEKKQIFAYVKTKAQNSCAVAAQLISAFVFATQIVHPSSIQIRDFKLLPIFCGCTGQFVSDLVGNTETRFSHVAAHLT